MKPQPTLAIREACSQTWDAIVIGAGPAGSLAARGLAQHKLRTLLVEAKSFPRFKVCGGCLNQRSLRGLAALGLDDLVADSHGIPLTELRIVMNHQQITLGLPAGAVLTRQKLDQVLVSAAIEAGAQFLPGTLATVDPSEAWPLRCVNFRQGDQSGQLLTRIVVCADGIGRTSVRHIPALCPHVARGALVGVGTVLTTDQLSAAACERFSAGRVVMHVAPGGYVGVTYAESGQVIVAGALSPAFLKQHNGPGAAVAAVLAATGLKTLGDTSSATWQGTPALSGRTRRVATKGIFVVGDAAGYIEPFTGEGMSWAIESAAAATPLIARACTEWNAGLAASWERCYRRQIRQRQLVCKIIASLLRHPWATSLAFGVVRSFPAAAARMIQWLNQSPRGGPPVLLSN